MKLSLLFCLSFLYSYILSTSFFLKRKGSANARVAPITTVEYWFKILNIESHKLTDWFIIISIFCISIANKLSMKNFAVW